MSRTKGRYEAESSAPSVAQVLDQVVTPARAGALAFAIPLLLLVPTAVVEAPSPEPAAQVVPEPVELEHVNQMSFTVPDTGEAEYEPAMGVVTAQPAPEPRQEATGDQEQAEQYDTSRQAGASAESSRPAASADGSNADGERILQIAEQYVGVPYVWGGTSTSGWDCSAFTQHVFREAGINLPRNSGAQKAAGTVVSASEARAGDLVWHPGHVGIYAGNGMMYDAGTSAGTSYRSHSWMGAVTYVRVL